VRAFLEASEDVDIEDEVIEDLIGSIPNQDGEEGEGEDVDVDEDWDQAGDGGGSQMELDLSALFVPSYESEW
jgi:hypothetical protein